MKTGVLVPAVLVLVLILGSALAFKSFLFPAGTTKMVPTPTPVAVEQLPADKQPKVSLSFSSDGHYATINATNLNASQLEYNLIYNATVKSNQIQTGVSGSANISGQSDYSNKQLLGSESSGHFTYHEKINTASLELTLRDDNGYSIFSATYPFTVTAGKTVSLTPAQ